MPVGGSRHYDGGGLGPIGVWHCPTCGEDNAGPMAEGCAVCGAGRPGRHVGVPPPQAPEAPTPPEADDAQAWIPRPASRPEPMPAAPPRERDAATVWAEEHADVTVEEAYRAGFLEGVQRARLEFQQYAAQQQAQQTGRPLAGYVADDMIQRTIVAALELFRDQVLVGEPEETTTGEWLTAQQTTALIKQMKGEVHG